jgi:hypothetical protein
MKITLKELIIKFNSADDTEVSVAELLLENSGSVPYEPHITANSTGITISVKSYSDAVAVVAEENFNLSEK